MKSDLSHTAIRDELKQHLDKGDEILVVNITGDAAAWFRFDDQAGKWLKDNI